MNFSMRLLILLCVVWISSFVHAQWTQNLNTHFVIVVDGAMPAYVCDVTHLSTRDLVEEQIKRLGSAETGDYLSVVSYQVDRDCPDFDNFAWIPYDLIKQRIRWRPLTERWYDSISWSDVVGFQHSRKMEIGANRVSFQSAAKPYVVRALREQENKGANRMYFLMLTDEKVNGLDDNYRNEWNNIAIGQERMSRCQDAVFSTIEQVNRLFDYEVVSRKVIAYVTTHPLCLVIYEIVPKTFLPLQSIANVPARLPIQRIKGGYAMDMNLASVKAAYTVERVEVSVKDEVVTEAEGDSLKLDLSGTQVSEGDTLTIRTWVRYNDGVYGGLVMNPYDPRYAEALTVSQVVNCGDEARILGKLPLCDEIWWFYPRDIQRAVITWDVLIILAFILLVCCAFYLIFNRITRFVPSNKRIKLKKIHG